jgi:uncharacterized protein YaaR (DUF327 family)
MDDVIKAILKKWCLDPYCVDAMKEYAEIFADEQSKKNRKRIEELEIAIESAGEDLQLFLEGGDSKFIKDSLQTLIKTLKP